MSKIEWPSEEEKWISIGYLSKQGVISSIEATVKKGQSREFQLKFRGKYDSNFPYEADKYGSQFRINLNKKELDGCPDFLYDQLDDQYKSRINDNDFIEDLVLNWGFRFSNKPVDSGKIYRIAKEKGDYVFKYFRRGRYPDLNFITSLYEKIQDRDNLISPTIKHIPKRESHADKSNRINQSLSDEHEYSSTYRPRLGWIGEAYIYNLLKKENSEFYNAIGLVPQDITDIIWFNKGFLTTNHQGNWIDQSVGLGYDLLVNTKDVPFFIEVKSNKNNYPIFTMTANEIQKMAELKKQYYLIKIDYLERILRNCSPEVRIYTNPYEYFFNVNQIHEASFYLE